MNGNLVPLIAFFAAIGIFFAYVHPTWSGTIAETRAAIAANDDALTAAKKYTAQQNQLAAARDAIDPTHLDALEKLLPSSVNNVGLILDLNTLAARSGLSVSNIDVITTSSGAGAQAQNPGVLPAGSANPVNAVDLSLSATGTFSGLQQFLQGIERSARLLDVRDLVIKGSDTGVYTYTMVIRLYWLR